MWRCVSVCVCVQTKRIHTPHMMWVWQTHYPVCCSLFAWTRYHKALYWISAFICRIPLELTDLISKTIRLTDCGFGLIVFPLMGTYLKFPNPMTSPQIHHNTTNFQLYKRISFSSFFFQCLNIVQTQDFLSWWEYLVVVCLS